MNRDGILGGHFTFLNNAIVSAGIHPGENDGDPGDIKLRSLGFESIIGIVIQVGKRCGHIIIVYEIVQVSGVLAGQMITGFLICQNVVAPAIKRKTAGIFVVDEISIIRQGMIQGRGENIRVLFLVYEIIQT